MTPSETARRVKMAVIHAGAAFGHEASFAEAGRRLGLDPWAFYFGARAGVLGTVEADVVIAACGFFAPDLVRPAWKSALAATSRCHDRDERMSWLRQPRQTPGRKG